jgi:hypothetical protein
MLVRVALQVLCKFWSCTPDYEDRVMSFMRKAEWDEDDDVRQMAFSIAGVHLRMTKAPQMLAELLQVVDDESERPVLRSDAYPAIARQIGKEWTELPKVSRLPPIDQLIDRAVIEQATRRLAEEGVR